MAAKAVLILCAQALIAQTAFSQCLRPGAIDARLGGPFGLAGRDWSFDGPYDGFSAPFGVARPTWACGPGMDITLTSGGGLPVNSASAFPPVGLTVTSENYYEGLLSAVGELPFVGTIALEGALPSSGAGAVNYGCGNGVTAMVSDTITDPGFNTPAIGYGAGWAGRGCGCGI